MKIGNAIIEADEKYRRGNPDLFLCVLHYWLVWSPETLFNWKQHNKFKSISFWTMCLQCRIVYLCVLHVLHKSNCLSFKRNCEHVCIYFLNIVLQIKDAANVLSRYCLSRLYALPLLPICICLSVNGKKTLPIEKLIFRNGQPVRDDVRGIFISMASTKGQCILILCSFCVSSWALSTKSL
jgi:hypothetical protein